MIDFKDLTVIVSVVATAIVPLTRLFLLRNASKASSVPPRRTSSGVGWDEETSGVPVRPSAPSGQKIFKVFALVLGLLGVVTVISYFQLITANRDTIFFGLWLFAIMVAGMFVQVMFANYQTGKGLIETSATELAVPLCFSVVVYYSIWTVAASAPRGIFPFYAAFVNGYFWRNIVSSIKPPEQPKK